jgi:hypothetical protein
VPSPAYRARFAVGWSGDFTRRSSSCHHATPSPTSVVSTPSPGVWSVTEYVCHLRDVYVSFTIRLHRVRTEHQPAWEPMFNDLRVRRFRYNDCDLAATLDELAAAAAGFCDEVARTGEHEWNRVATRLPGEQRTARWLVRQAMHEGVHHLGDIHRIGETLSGAAQDRERL